MLTIQTQFDVLKDLLIKVIWLLFQNRYYVIGIELEAFYMLFKSQWWGAINEVISTLKPKRLPLTDTQAMDQFKKRFGYRKAIKCKVCFKGLNVS